MFDKINFKPLAEKISAFAPGGKPRKKADRKTEKEAVDSVQLNRPAPRRIYHKRVSAPSVFLPNLPGEKPTIRPISLAKINDFSENFFLTDNYCLSWDRFREIRGETPNLRKIDGIYGLAQPTLKGMKQLLEKEAPKAGKITWVNLRSEAVIYLNKYPYSIKHKDNLRENYKLNTINPREVKVLEEQLKSEVVDALARNEKLVCLNVEGETPKEFTISRENLRPRAVKTVSQAFEELSEKYPVEYKRIPINDEKRPANKEFDMLVDCFKDPQPGQVYVVNCQAGYGRTTTAMTVFSLMRQAENNPQTPMTKNPGWREEIRRHGLGKFSTLKALLSAGKIAETAINSQVLEGRGVEGFHRAVDSQGKGGQHMLKVINKYAREDPDKARDFIERYVYLAAFYRYCREESPRHYQQPFSQWVQPHKSHLKTVIRQLNGVLEKRSEI